MAEIKTKEKWDLPRAPLLEIQKLKIECEQRERERESNVIVKREKGTRVYLLERVVLWDRNNVVLNYFQTKFDCHVTGKK